MIGWARRVVDALGPSSFSGAGYGNYAMDEPADRVRAAFGPERFERLAQVKRRYDPDNVFRFNHNIPPAGRLRTPVAVVAAPRPPRSPDRAPRGRRLAASAAA